MAEPWTFAGEAPSLVTGSAVTLVEESTFCISSPSGDIEPGTAQGLMLADTRLLSTFDLRVDGWPLEALTALVGDPFTATFVSRTSPSQGLADSTLVVFRHRYVGRGLREDLVVRNHGEEPVTCVLEVRVDADFADLFEVKEGRVGSGRERQVEVGRGRITIDACGPDDDGPRRRGVVVDVHGFDETRCPGLATAEVVIGPQGEWRGCLSVAAVIDGVVVAPRYACGQPVEEATPSERLTRWRRQVPVVLSDHNGLDTAVRRSQEDLGALRMFDPDHPDRTVIAAGAPWFMTVFGRDSLLTSSMALLVDPDLALGVLQTLARFQGTEVVADTEEEPGRILHEMRFGTASSLSLGGGSIYYGTVDATPLFVMLLGELRRWGLAADLVDDLLPHADRALDWITEFGDRDGDGYVEYERASPKGLRNQGWKDSWDGVRAADGRLGEGPIALAEVQGYVYSAYLARSYFALEAGDAALADRWRVRAADLKVAFNRDFWQEDGGWFVLGLDGDKRPLDALASNVGHCLWTGIVDEDKAAAVAASLVSPAMFTGWGIRTLASTMAGYNPTSYHNGSVWPHDSAIAVAGLMRYGFVEEAQRVAMGLLDAAAASGGRLPELFGGLDRAELGVPLGYPASCSPQAWAAAAPLLVLRSLLRLDPWVPHGKVWLAPALPPTIRHLWVDRIPLGGGRVRVQVEGGVTEVEGLPPGVELVSEPRRPLTGVKPEPGHPAS
ncbi:MAG: amylo-alpha-1,6-glucosidase [Actinomycetota bacterium]|nr:amylo-alpha-1,6-glucosidase [Actinomycetota bacterium]